jgi:hypothetical protein
VTEQAPVIADEFSLLSDEAKADAAPVAGNLDYQSRHAWKPGKCVGFIVNTSSPVARLKWPKRREAKEFFLRMADCK